MTAPRTTDKPGGQHPILKNSTFARPQGHAITYHAQTSQQPKPKFLPPESLPIQALSSPVGSPAQAHAARMHGEHQDYLAHQAAQKKPIDNTRVQPTLVDFDINLEHDPHAPRKASTDLRFVEGALLAMGENHSNFIGWDESGFFHTDFDQRNGNHHEQKIGIFDRFGRTVEFHFWDKSQGNARTPKIHDWNITSPKTDEYRQFTQNGEGLKINCNQPAYEKYAASVFDKPLSDQIIVYTYIGNEGGPYEGCQLELIISCGLPAHGHKAFQHKVLVGLVVQGDNRAKGIASWRATFNRNEWLAERPDSTKAQWTFDGPIKECFVLSLENETQLFNTRVDLGINDTKKGYSTLPDPIKHEDRLLIITPNGNFVSIAAYEAAGKTHLVADKPVLTLIPEKTKNGDERFTLPLPNDDKGNARQLILTKKDGAWQAIKETGGEQVPLTEASRRAKIYAGVFIVRPDKNRRKPSYHPPIGVFQIPHNGQLVTLAMILEHDEATGYFSTAGQVSPTQWSLNQRPTLSAPLLPGPSATPTHVLPKKVPAATPSQATFFTGDFNPFADDSTGQTGRLIIDLNGHGKLVIEGAKVQHDVGSTGDAENLELTLDQLIGELIQTDKPDNENATAVFQDGNRLFIEGVGTMTLVHADKISGHILVDVGFKAEIIRPDGDWQDITFRLDPTQKAHVDPLIGGRNYSSLVLPWVPDVKERQYYNPIHNMARLAEDHSGRRLSISFIGARLGKEFPSFVAKTDPLHHTPIWTMTLDLEADGHGHLKPRTQAHDGKIYTFIKELNYHFSQQRPDGSIDFRPISENEVFAEVVETGTNTHGWAVKIDFAGRTIYLQPINPPSNRGDQTAVIGLSISTELIEPTNQQKSIFQRIMQKLDAYRQAPEVFIRGVKPADVVTALPADVDNGIFVMDDTGGIKEVLTRNENPAPLATTRIEPIVVTAPASIPTTIVAPKAVQPIALVPPITSNFSAVVSAYYRALLINNETPIITYNIPNYPYDVECTIGFTDLSGRRTPIIKSTTAVAKTDGHRIALISEGTGMDISSYDRRIKFRIDGIEFFIAFYNESNSSESYKNEAYPKYQDLHLWRAGLKTQVTKPENYPPLILAQPTPEKMGREAWQGWRLPDGGKFEIKLEHKTERNKTRWSFARIQAGRTGTAKVRFQIGDMAKHATGEAKATNLEENADYQIVELSELSMQIILDRKTGTVYPLQPSLKTLNELTNPRADWRPTKLPLERVAYHVGLRKISGGEKSTELVLPLTPIVAEAPAPEPTPASPSPFNEAEHLALVEIEKTRAGFTEALLNFINTKTDDDALAFLAQARQFLTTFHKTNNKNSAILTIIQQSVPLDRKPPIEKATAALKAMLATYQ